MHYAQIMGSTASPPLEVFGEEGVNPWLWEKKSEFFEANSELEKNVGECWVIDQHYKLFSCPKNRSEVTKS